MRFFSPCGRWISWISVTSQIINCVSDSKAILADKNFAAPAACVQIRRFVITLKFVESPLIFKFLFRRACSYWQSYITEAHRRNRGNEISFVLSARQTQASVNLSRKPRTPRGALPLPGQQEVLGARGACCGGEHACAEQFQILDLMTLRELLGERRFPPPDAKIINASQVKQHNCVHWVLKFPSPANDSVRRPCPPPEEGQGLEEHRHSFTSKYKQVYVLREILPSLIRLGKVFS